MKKSLHLLVIALLCSCCVYAQNIKGFYIGHSLTDYIPEMVKSLATSTGGPTFNNHVFQSIPGSPLTYQWDQKASNGISPIPPAYYGFYDPINGLPNGTFDILVLTESVPRTMSPWSIPATYAYADSFFIYAKSFNTATKVYLYEPWHCINSGTPTGCAWDINTNPWRQRLTDDLPMWESVVDTLNARHPLSSPPVCLIPGGQGLARLFDSIQIGAVPGVTTLTDIFEDDIHLNDTGRYFIALIHYAMIFNASPVGLTNQTYSIWGTPFGAPSVALAAKLQQIAYETVLNYPNTCFISSPLSVPTNVQLKLYGKYAANKSKVLNWNITGSVGTDKITLQKKVNNVYIDILNIDKETNYTDSKATEAEETYKLKLVNLNNHSKYSNEITIGTTLPKLLIHPNPTNDFITVDSPNLEEFIKYIYNTNGECVIKTMNNTIDIRELPSGVYYIHCNNMNNVVTKL